MSLACSTYSLTLPELRLIVRVFHPRVISTARLGTRTRFVSWSGDPFSSLQLQLLLSVSRQLITTQGSVIWSFYDAASNETWFRPYKAVGRQSPSYKVPGPIRHRRSLITRAERRMSGRASSDPRLTTIFHTEEYKQMLRLYVFLTSDCVYGFEFTKNRDNSPRAHIYSLI